MRVYFEGFAQFILIGMVSACYPHDLLEGSEIELPAVFIELFNDVAHLPFGRIGPYSPDEGFHIHRVDPPIVVPIKKSEGFSVVPHCCMLCRFDLCCALPTPCFPFWYLCPVVSFFST